MRPPTVPDTHRHLLEAPIVATLATLRPDGSPQCNPVWFAWDGEHLRLSQATGTRKVRNVRADPRTSLTIVDPGDPFHYLEVRGVVDAIDPDPDLAFLASLARRYLGEGAAFRPPEERVVVRIAPTGFARELGLGAGRDR